MKDCGKILVAAPMRICLRPRRVRGNLTSEPSPKALSPIGRSKQIALFNLTSDGRICLQSLDDTNYLQRVSWHPVSIRNSMPYLFDDTLFGQPHPNRVNRCNLRNVSSTLGWIFWKSKMGSAGFRSVSGDCIVLPFASCSPGVVNFSAGSATGATFGGV